MIATQHSPRNSPYTTPTESTRTKGTGLVSSITGGLLGTAHYDNEKFENAIKRCIPAEFVLIASQDDNNTAQEDFFAMDNYDMGRNVPKYVRKANAGACATTALLQLLYEHPEKAVADNCRRARMKPLNVLQVSQEIKKRVKKHSKLNARPTISSSRPLGPPRLDKEHAPFYIVPPNKRGIRRALLIGVVAGQGDDLKGPPNDIANMQGFLEKHCGFQRHNITVLQDFWEGGGNGKPTKRNILGGFQTLVRSSRPGDVCFIGFSGHGGRIGNQLYICPSDYKKAGQVSDEMIMKDLIKAMPADVYTTMVVDCCYSGTVGDLPYVLSHNKTNQKIDSYYDTDMRKEMLAKEKENSEAYQEYKKARAERRLVGRLADVAAVIADTATAAGKAAINAPIKTAKATADAAVFVGKGVGQGVVGVGKGVGQAGMATAGAAKAVGKGVGQGVVGVGKGTATVARVAGKTLDAGVRGSTNAATSAAKAGLRGSANAAKTVGKAGIGASKTIGMVPINAARHSAGAASLVASAAASGLRSSTSGAASALRSSTSAAKAGLRNSTGSMGNMKRRSRSADPAISCSTKRDSYNYYDEQPGGSENFDYDDDNLSIGSTHSAGSTASSGGKKKKGSFKRVLPKRWATTGSAPSTKPSEPLEPSNSSNLDSSAEFKDKEEEPVKKRTASKSPTRADMGNSLGKLSTIHRRRSFIKKDEAMQAALSQSRRNLLEASLNLCDLEQEEDPVYGSYSSTNGARTSSCDTVSSDCSSKQTARTSAMSLSSFLSSSSQHRGEQEEDDDVQSHRSSASTSSGKRKSRGKLRLTLSSPAMTMNTPSDDGEEDAPKRSSISNALKRTGTSLASGAAGAANSLRRSATQPVKQAAKAEEEARKEAVERSKREAMEARRQSGGITLDDANTNNSSTASPDENTEEPLHDSQHKRSSNGRKSRGRMGRNISFEFSSPAMTMNVPDTQEDAPPKRSSALSKAFKRTGTGLASGAANTFRRSATQPVSSDHLRKSATQQVSKEDEEKASSKFSNSVSALSSVARGASNRFRRSNTTSPIRKKSSSPFRRSNTVDKAAIPGEDQTVEPSPSSDMEPKEDGHKEAIEQSTEEPDARRSFARGRSPGKRRFTAINFELAMEADERARNEAIEKSREEAARARASARGSAVRPRKSVMDLAMSFEAKDAMAALDTSDSDSEYEEAMEEETEELSNKQQQNSEPDFIPGFRGARRMTAINRMLAEDAEREAQEKTSRESARGSTVRPRKSVMDLAMSFEAKAAMAELDASESDSEYEEPMEEEAQELMNKQQHNSEPDFIPGFRGSRRMTAINRMLAEDAEKEAAEEAEKEEQEKTVQQDTGFIPGFRGTRRMTAINRMLAEDEEMEAQDRARQEAEKEPDTKKAPRSSGTLLAATLEAEGLEMSESSAGEREMENTVEPTFIPGFRGARRMTAINRMLAEDEAQEEQERSARSSATIPSKPQSAGMKKGSPGPVRPRKSVMMMAMNFEKSSSQVDLDSKDVTKSSVTGKESPVRPRKSVMMMASAFGGSAGHAEANADNKSENQKENSTEEPKPQERPSLAMMLASALDSESIGQLSDSDDESQSEYEEDMEEEENKEESAANDHPQQRRSTAINLEMAAQAEEVARQEALERSRREAAEAKAAARKARLEREGKMLANGRPAQRAQRRSTAVNFEMALKAEEAARQEALERSRREAQEAREAARRARQRAC